MEKKNCLEKKNFFDHVSQIDTQFVVKFQIRVYIIDDIWGTTRFAQTIYQFQLELNKLKIEQDKISR